MTPDVPMSTLLPPDIRNALVLASRVESRIEAGESDVRAQAVDAAAAAARKFNPQLFHKE